MQRASVSRSSSEHLAAQDVADVRAEQGEGAARTKWTSPDPCWGKRGFECFSAEEYCVKIGEDTFTKMTCPPSRRWCDSSKASTGQPCVATKPTTTTTTTTTTTSPTTPSTTTASTTSSAGSTTNSQGGDPCNGKEMYECYGTAGYCVQGIQKLCPPGTTCSADVPPEQSPCVLG